MFLTKTRAAVDGDRSAWGQFWFEPIGLRTGAGERVTSASALRLSAVYSCVRVLAETFAVLPFCLYRKRTDGGRDMVTDHWLYRLMRIPNQWQTGFEWREMMQAHLALRGNAYNQIVSNSKGEITALVPMHPDAVTMKINTDGSFFYTVKQRDGTSKDMAAGDVWHIKGMSSDGYMGMSPLELAAEVIGMGQAAQSYGARFFANDTKPGGWIEMAPGGKFADDAAKKTFMASWKSAYGGANRGSTAVLEGGMKYNELKIDNVTAQFLDSRKLNRSEIAAIFRVPSHLINDLEKATFSNIEQQSLDFVIYTMTPWAERWESSIETWLMLESDGEEMEVEFEFANLLRGDQAARATFYTSGINAGWMVRNEARILEGLNPLPGLWEPLRPLNMAKESQAADEVTKADADNTKKIPAATPDARAVALAQAAAERVARKELQIVKACMKSEDWPAAVTEAYRLHATFVAACMGVSLDAAQAYCESRRSDPLTRGTEEADFMACALSKLERLALKGTL